MMHKAKYKIARRLQAPVFEKTQSQKYALRNNKEASSSKGGALKKRKAPMTDYGHQVLEKQKAKAVYGLRERQFEKYVLKAIETKGNTVEKLLSRLESRLDNTVMRAGLSKSRAGARQLVSHGHIWVNGKRVNIASYEVRVGDVITIREGSKRLGVFSNVAEMVKAVKSPVWLSADLEKISFTVTAVPSVAVQELLFNPSTVLEFYTR